MDQEDQPQTGSSQPPPPATTAPPAPQPTSAPPPPPSPTAGPTATGQRPTGVTVLAILAAIAGVLGIFGGTLFLISGPVVAVATDSAELGVLGSVIGAVWLITAVAYLLFAWGAWGLQPWAWTLGIIIAAVSIVLGVVQLFSGDFSAIVSILIAGGITYYLFQPEVKAAFGRT